MRAIELARRAWRVFKKLGQLLGDGVAWVVLTVFYWSIMLPFAVVTRWFFDPLRIRASTDESFWIKRGKKSETLNDAMKQY